MRPDLSRLTTFLREIDAAVEDRCAGPGCTAPITAGSPSAWWCSHDGGVTVRVDPSVPYGHIYETPGKPPPG